MAGDTVARPRSRVGPALIDRLAALIHQRGVRLALWAAAVVAEVAVLAPVVLRGAPVDPVDVILRLIGGSFAACGLIAWRRRPDSRSGLLMTATGFAFLLPALLRDHDSLFAATVASWLSDLWTLFFIPLVLTYCTGGRLRTTADRVLLGAVVVEIVVLAPLWLVFADDPATLLLAVPDPQVAKVIDSVQRALYLALSVGTAGVVAVRWRASSPPGRRAMLPSVAGAVCLLLWAALLDRRPGLGRRAPPDPALERGLLDRAGADRVPRRPAAVAAGARRPGRPVRRARDDAARRAAGGAGAGAARPGVHDRLRGAGRRVRRRPTARRSSFPGRRPAGRSARVPRDGDAVAALVYDRSLDDDPELVEAVGGAATIALENRLLQAQSDARLAELQASRQRLVTAADTERRRIERNLHDGAQQRLVTLALQLSLIQRRIRDDPGDAEQLVASASDELAQSLAELRELARGIHPAALEQGLEPALEALVLRSAVPDGAGRRARAPAAAAGRVRRVLRGVGGAGERGEVRRRHGGRRRGSAVPTAAGSSRSPTTASAGPIPPRAQACAASRTGWRPSGAGSRCRARRVAARSWARSCPRPDPRPVPNAQRGVPKR